MALTKNRKQIHVQICCFVSKICVYSLGKCVHRVC